jgi:hypothetical protein
MLSVFHRFLIEAARPRLVHNAKIGRILACAEIAVGCGRGLP